MTDPRQVSGRNSAGSLGCSATVTTAYAPRGTGREAGRESQVLSRLGCFAGGCAGDCRALLRTTTRSRAGLVMGPPPRGRHRHRRACVTVTVQWLLVLVLGAVLPRAAAEVEEMEGRRRLQQAIQFPTRSLALVGSFSVNHASAPQVSERERERRSQPLHGRIPSRKPMLSPPCFRARSTYARSILLRTQVAAVAYVDAERWCGMRCCTHRWCFRSSSRRRTRVWRHATLCSPATP